MRILLWHGYLLTGSGSNVYTANIAREWRKAGHDVMVLCQDRAAAALDFVDHYVDLASDGWDAVPDAAEAPAGRCVVVRPDIGSILPVYVFDEYEGFRAKLFVDLTEAELDAYTDHNVAALERALERHRPDAVVTGHEVMGPYIARVACDATGHGYLAKLHGSALEYAVKLQDRYQSFATKGLDSARVVVGGSRYMVQEAASVVPGWLDRAAVVNPGCDVDLFKPIDRPEPDVPVVGYVGKLIASKGVHNLLAALPLLEHRARAVIVGYGGFADGLRALWAALQAGDRATIARIAAEGESGPLEGLAGLADRPDSYFERAASIDVEFPGRLEHDPLSRELPRFEVLVVPSVVAEAFGMVAAEAAASGVLPVVPNHSGIAEAGAAVEEHLGRPGFLTYDAADPVEGIAAAVDRVLALPHAERLDLGRRACELARDRWSWEHVATSLLELASQR